MILTLAKLVSSNYRELARRDKKIQVLTIDYSHFCELSIWALQEQKAKIT